MREVAKQQEDKAARSRLVAELLTLHFIASSITLVLYAISVLVLWSKIQDIRLLLFSLSSILVNFFACEWYFLGMERFRYITIRSLITRLSGLASIFILIKAPPDYYIYYAIMVAAGIGNGVCNIYKLYKELPLHFKGLDWKKHIHPTRTTYLISQVYSISLLLDNVLLRLVSTATAVGYYAFSIRMVRMSSQLLTDSLLVFFPRIVYKLKGGDASQSKQIVDRNLQLLIFFSVPMCVGIFLLADPLVKVFLGAAFIPAIVNLKMLALFPLLKSLNLFLSNQLLIAHNQERLCLKSFSIGNFLFIGLTLLLSWQFQDKGACMAILITEVITLVLSGYYVRRSLGGLYTFNWQMLFHACIGSCLFIPVVYGIGWTTTSNFWWVVWSIILCMTAYFIVQLFILRNDFSLLLKEYLLRPFRRSQPES